MIEKLRNLVWDEEGQGLVEYGLIIALVSVLLIGALGLLKEGIEGAFGDATSALNGE
ncbi:MAG: Flp family type IVb pilin [Aminobacterium sp.]|jgi:pilus assembly protein Flp/PilA